MAHWKNKVRIPRMAVQVAASSSRQLLGYLGCHSSKGTHVPLLLMRLMLLLMMFCFAICVKWNGFALVFCLALHSE